MKVLLNLPAFKRISQVLLISLLFTFAFAISNPKLNELKQIERSKITGKFKPFKPVEYQHPHTFLAKSATVDKQKLGESISEELNEDTDTWENSGKDQFTYDNDENMTVNIFSFWDDSLNVWDKWEKAEKTYDENHNPIIENDYHWEDDIADWELDSEKNKSYDGNGNLTQSISSYVPWEGDTLVLGNKTTYSYNDQDQILQILTDSWIDSSSIWLPYIKMDFVYDVSGNNTSDFTYFMDSAWVASSKTEMTYDVNGNMIENIDSYWDKANSQWVDNTKITQTFNGSGNVLENIYYYYNVGAVAWQEIERSVSAYDANQNQISKIAYTWNSGWVEYWKTESIFNLSYTQNDLILPSWHNNYINNNNMKTFDYTYAIRSEAWKMLWRDTYSYSPYIVTGIANIQISPFQIFPNPAKDVVYIRPYSENARYEIEVFNVAGKRIMSKEQNGKTQLSLNNMPSGIYFVRTIVPGMQAKTQRIVVK